MMRFVPWLLVALCFVLGVASRSIGDSFPVFVPALEQAFGASRGDITIIYSFALLVGGISGPVNGWILDRLGLRVLTVLGMSLAAAATFLASHATALWHFYVTLGLMLGFGGASVSGVLSASLLGRWFPARRLGVGLAVAWSATGVGTMPTSTTSTPASRRPSPSARLSSGPESRPSRAITTASPPCARTSLPNARPMACAVSASSVLPITPRMS